MKYNAFIKNKRIMSNIYVFNINRKNMKPLPLSSTFKHVNLLG